MKRKFYLLIVLVMAVGSAIHAQVDTVDYWLKNVANTSYDGAPLPAALFFVDEFEGFDGNALKVQIISKGHDNADPKSWKSWLISLGQRFPGDAIVMDSSYIVQLKAKAEGGTKNIRFMFQEQGFGNDGLPQSETWFEVGEELTTYDFKYTFSDTTKISPEAPVKFSLFLADDNLTLYLDDIVVTYAGDSCNNFFENTTFDMEKYFKCTAVGIHDPFIDQLDVQVYPNPANALTHFSFSVSKNAAVSIDLYNLTGRKVATLLNKHLEAGYYEIPVDLNNENIKSGMYLYTVKTVRNGNVKSFSGKLKINQ